MIVLNTNVSYFNNIWIEPPIERILYRLGYRKGKTVLTKEQEEEIEKLIWEALSLCRPKGAFLILPILKRDEESVTIGEHIIKSRSLSKLLKYSDDVALMASTIGHEIIDSINNEIKKGNSVKAVTFDSTASQVADKTVEWVMEYINNTLKKEARRLTSFRYSPGYGDLDLKYQEMFFKELNLEKLEMSLTKSFMMVPEKSVTAICGVEKFEGKEDTNE